MKIHELFARRPALKRREAQQPLAEIVRGHVRAYFQNHGESLPAPGVYERILPLMEKPLIEVALEATHGNQLKAALVLGINRNTLRKKIAALGINPARYLNRHAENV